MNSLILHPHESRGLLAGTVTQIRRDIKQQQDIKYMRFMDICPAPNNYDEYAIFVDNFWPVYTPPTRHKIKVPFPTGSRIYCRETWKLTQPYDPDTYYFGYKDGWHSDEPASNKFDWHSPDEWHSPATMPREAARLFIEFEAVRAGRVQDITEGDAVRCGVERLNETEWKAYADIYPMGPATAKESYHTLYNSIHGPGAWERNNWQWIFTVRRINKL